MIRPVAQALWSHWRHHPVQLFTLIAGLAIATALWSAVQAINAEARASYSRAEAQMTTAAQILIDPEGAISVPRYVALRRAGAQVSPVLTGDWVVNGHRYSIRGVDFLSFLQGPLTDSALAAPRQGSPDGTAFDQMFAAPQTAAQLRPDWPVQDSDNLAEGTVLMDISRAEILLNRVGEIDQLMLQTPFARLAQIDPALTLSTPQGATDSAQLTRSFHLNLTAFGLLSFAVGLFIVHGAVGLAFEQRRPMIRTLRALGVPMRPLMAMILGELALLALLAGALGLVMGYALAGLLLPGVSATLRGLYGAAAQDELTLRAGWVLAGLAMALTGAGLGSAQAIWRVSRMPLLSIPGQQGWSTNTQQVNRRLAALGIALALAGGLAITLFDGLLAGFALLAGIMLGAALLLPPVLSGLLSLGGRTARGPLSEWVWADLRAQVPGLSLALMALLLALAANIGVTTMVSSFRHTFTGWLDQRLVSELYITARDDAQGAQIADWAKGRADAVLPIRKAELTYNGAPLPLYGVVDHATYRDHWPLVADSPGLWDRIADGTGVLINEQLARRDDLWPGDLLDLDPAWSLPIVGVYSDYGNTTAQAIIAMEALLTKHPQIPNQRFGLRVASAKAADLAADLREAFNLPATAVIEQSALKAQSLAVFDRTFVVTQALNVLTLSVAGFAMLTSLLTLWAQRLPQLAPIWALGQTRAQLARLEILRSVALAALTAVLALPLGLGLAWVLLQVINVHAFGWQLPMILFPRAWIGLFVLALLAAALAALIPARRLYRLPPTRLLLVFSHAR